MQLNRWWVMGPALALLACGCGSDGDGAVEAAAPETGEFQFPEGDDSIVPTAGVLAGPEGGLVQSIEIAGSHLYACSASHGLYVARIDGPSAVVPVTQGAAFPDGTGCRLVTPRPMGRSSSRA